MIYTIHDYARMVLTRMDGIDEEIKPVASVLLRDKSIKEGEDYEAIIEQLRVHYKAGIHALSKFRIRYKAYLYDKCNKKSKKQSGDSGRRRGRQKRRE